MIIKHIQTDMLGVNSYVLCDEKTGEGAVVDPAAFSPVFKKALAEAGVKKLRYLLCTHGHFDHVFGIYDFKESYPEAQVCISKFDVPMLSDAYLNLAYHFGLQDEYKSCNADILLEDNMVLPLGSTEIKVRNAPGHSMGSVIFQEDKDKLLFVGDVVFKGSIGRTDFPGSDIQQMAKTLEFVKKYDDAYSIFPGHKGMTTIGDEKKYNYYLR